MRLGSLVSSVLLVERKRDEFCRPSFFTMGMRSAEILGGNVTGGAAFFDFLPWIDLRIPNPLGMIAGLRLLRRCRNCFKLPLLFFLLLLLPLFTSLPFLFTLHCSLGTLQTQTRKQAKQQG